MIIFASKLILAVFSPLSIAFILSIVSIAALCRRRLRISLACNLATLGILGLLGNTFIAHAVLRPLEMRNLTSGAIAAVDAIVVLGGITSPAYPPQPITHLGCDGDRLVYAAELYHEGKAPVVVVSGGVMPWDESFPRESEQMAELLRIMGVPASAILQESGSRILTKTRRS